MKKTEQGLARLWMCPGFMVMKLSNTRKTTNQKAVSNKYIISICNFWSTSRKIIHETFMTAWPGLISYILSFQWGSTLKMIQFSICFVTAKVDIQNIYVTICHCADIVKKLHSYHLKICTRSLFIKKVVD